VTERDQQLAHLTRLAGELEQRGFVTELASQISKLHLHVVNAETPTLTERVLCYRTIDDTWMFWWPWKQPIGPVDDLTAVIEKIAAVLKSVEGA